MQYDILRRPRQRVINFQKFTIVVVNIKCRTFLSLSLPLARRCKCVYAIARALLDHMRFARGLKVRRCILDMFLTWKMIPSIVIDS